MYRTPGGGEAVKAGCSFPSQSGGLSAPKSFAEFQDSPQDELFGTKLFGAVGWPTTLDMIAAAHTASPSVVQTGMSYA
jgi:hypothetical protein